MSDRPDIILLYRVREGALLGGGSYVVQLPSGRLQTVETRGPASAPPGQVYYGTDPAVAVRHPGPCPLCDAFALCDCAAELDDDLGNARHVGEQLSGALRDIVDLHPSGCDPESGRLVCETCRQSYPCATVAAVQALGESAARLLWERMWS